MAYPYQTANEEYEILKAFARHNRNNPTSAESLLWAFLQNRQSGFKFRRQHIIKDYIVDFVCLHKKIVIEVDGEYHYQEGQIIKDTERTEDLQLRGFKVIRFTNEEVLFNAEAVFATIKEELMSNEQTINNGLHSPLLMEGSGVAADAWAVDAACSGNPVRWNTEASTWQLASRCFISDQCTALTTSVSSWPSSMLWPYNSRWESARPSIVTATTPSSG